MSNSNFISFSLIICFLQLRHIDSIFIIYAISYVSNFHVPCIDTFIAINFYSWIACSIVERCTVQASKIFLQGYRNIFIVSSNSNIVVTREVYSVTFFNCFWCCFTISGKVPSVFILINSLINCISHVSSICHASCTCSCTICYSNILLFTSNCNFLTISCSFNVCVVAIYS